MELPGILWEVGGAKREIDRCHTAGFEDGERNQEPRNVGGLLEAGNHKEVESP